MTTANANFQGVGSPHAHAALQPGETVLDLGSGLGIDSFIAAAAVGSSGRVVGIDIAKKEVRHAAARAVKRGLGEDRLRFLPADLEQVDHAPAHVHVAWISDSRFTSF